MSERPKRMLLAALCTVVIICLAAAIAWQAWSLRVNAKAGAIAAPGRLGNWDANLRAAENASKMSLPANGEIRFIVAGDSRCYGTFEVLMDELRQLKPDFMVLLGDISRTSTPESHRFMRLEMATEMATDFPVFYAIGNHDIGPGFTVATWEKTYGPRQCYFTIRENLFIIAYIPQEEDMAAPGLDYLEETLRSQAPSAKRIFVFNHIPPNLGFEWAARNVPHQDRLMKLLDDYKVNYLVAGDYHGYARIHRGALNLVVSGGGGADLSGGSLGFHHAVQFTIRDGAVQERICVVPGILALNDRLEDSAICGVVPFMGRHPVLAVGANAVIVALMGVLIVALVRLRPFRRQRSG